MMRPFPFFFRRPSHSTYWDRQALMLRPILLTQRAAYIAQWKRRSLQHRLAHASGLLAYRHRAGAWSHYPRRLHPLFLPLVLLSLALNRHQGLSYLRHCWQNSVWL